MKILFALSLLGNIILGYLYFTRSPEIIVEKTIVESHPGKDSRTRVKPVQGPQTFGPGRQDHPSDDNAKSANSGPKPFEPDPHIEHDFAVAAEKVEQDKQEFLTQELKLDQSTLLIERKLKEEHLREIDEIFRRTGQREMTFNDRRKLIDLEERLHHDLRNLYGPKKWEKYQKFRERYNSRGFKDQNEADPPFIFMSL